VKGENGDLRADSYNILNRRKNYFSQLLNVDRASVVWQIEIHTAEPLVPDPSPLYNKTDIAKLKRCKSPGSDEIPAELIQAEGETLRSEIHKLINIWKKEELHDQWKEFIIVPFYKKGNKSDCSNYQGMTLLSTLYKILSNILLSWLSPYVGKIIGNHQRGFQHKRLTIGNIFFFTFNSYWRKNGSIMRQYISYS
jgi:hypothetical protein